MTSFSSSEEDLFYSPEGEVECGYPNCKRGLITAPYVKWDLTIPMQTIYSMFPPVVKLAIQENSDPNRQKYRMMELYIHPECAAEWGMHLVKDALQANAKVGRKLRSAEESKGQYNEF